MTDLGTVLPLLVAVQWPCAYTSISSVIVLVMGNGTQLNYKQHRFIGSVEFMKSMGRTT